MTERADNRTLGSRDGALTALVAVGGLALAALITTLAVLEVGGDAVANALGLYGDAFVQVLSAAVIFYAAHGISDRLARRTWQLIGVGTLLLGVGDAIWGVGHLVFGMTQSPIFVADPFYIAGYVVLGVAMLRYAASFSDEVDLAWITTETLVFCAIMGVTLWVGLLAPAVAAAGGIAPYMAVDLMYILLDFALLLAPITYLLFVVGRLRDHTLASPWSAVALAILITIIADVVWFWERAHTGWLPGSFADFGFMASGVLMATGAMAALDASHRIERARQIEHASRRAA
jgi:hypothetical protein